jgi:hypothetical protein
LFSNLHRAIQFLGHHARHITTLQSSLNKNVVANYIQRFLHFTLYILRNQTAHIAGKRALINRHGDFFTGRNNIFQYEC